MYQKNTNTTFFHQQNRIVIISCIIAFLAGFFLFLQSYQSGQLMDSLPSSSEKSPARLVRLTQAGDLANLTASSAQEDKKEDVSATFQEKQLLVDWISKRYPVDSKATALFVSAAYVAAHEIGLDPHLILAVMAIESSFNPEAESPVGAQGLMQVMTKVHSKKFAAHGGIKAAKDPVANIQVGSAILKEYVSRGGSVERGLKSYVGAAAYSHDFGYGAKVLAEYHRLKQVSRGKKVPTLLASKSSSKKLARSNTDKARVKMAIPAINDNPANIPIADPIAG